MTILQAGVEIGILRYLTTKKCSVLIINTLSTKSRRPKISWEVAEDSNVSTLFSKEYVGGSREMLSCAIQKQNFRNGTPAKKVKIFSEFPSTTNFDMIIKWEDQFQIWRKLVNNGFYRVDSDTISIKSVWKWLSALFRSPQFPFYSPDPKFWQITEGIRGWQAPKSTTSGQICDAQTGCRFNARRVYKATTFPRARGGGGGPIGDKAKSDKYNFHPNKPSIWQPRIQWISTMKRDVNGVTWRARGATARG